jgi:hypothetical protein
LIGPLLAAANKPGGGGLKMAAAIGAMVCAVEEKRITRDELARMKQKELSRLYPGAGRTTLAVARSQALAQLAAAEQTPTNDK